MGEASSLDKDAPDEALLAEDVVDPHLLASGVCEKERKSEHNSRAAGKGVGTASEGA